MQKQKINWSSAAEDKCSPEQTSPGGTRSTKTASKDTYKVPTYTLDREISSVDRRILKVKVKQPFWQESTPPNSALMVGREGQSIVTLLLSSSTSNKLSETLDFLNESQ